MIGYPPDQDRLESFVAEVGMETEEHQYGRWYDRVCPAVVGLQPEIGEYVRETVRSVAELVDAPLERDDCRANIVVLFTTEPDQAIQQHQQERPEMFGEISPADVDQIVRDDAIVSVVSRLSIRGGGGQMGSTSVSGALRGPGRNDVGKLSASNRIDGSNPSEQLHSTRHDRATSNFPGESAKGGGVHQQAEGSRLAAATRPEFDFRLIVFDLYDLEGQTIRQLPAYTAMIALGDFVLEQPIVSQNTILNAMHDAETAPADITDWDLAYLRGLYGMRPARSAAAQRRAIISGSGRSLRTGRF